MKSLFTNRCLWTVSAVAGSVIWELEEFVFQTFDYFFI